MTCQSKKWSAEYTEQFIEELSHELEAARRSLELCFSDKSGDLSELEETSYKTLEGLLLNQPESVPTTKARRILMESLRRCLELSQDKKFSEEYAKKIRGICRNQLRDLLENSHRSFYLGKPVEEEIKEWDRVLGRNKTKNLLSTKPVIRTYQKSRETKGKDLGYEIEIDEEALEKSISQHLETESQIEKTFKTLLKTMASDLYKGDITAWRQAIEIKDTFTKAHGVGLGSITGLLDEALGRESPEIDLDLENKMYCEVLKQKKEETGNQ